MGIGSDRLMSTDAHLVGFTITPFQAEGIITLPLTIGNEPVSRTIMINFMIVKISITYNAILGRSNLNALRVVVSTYHLLINVPVD